MLALAEYDFSHAQSQSTQLIQALFERDGELPVKSAGFGHNLFSIIWHFGTEDQTTGPDIVEFMRKIAFFSQQWEKPDP